MADGLKIQLQGSILSSLAQPSTPVANSATSRSGLPQSPLSQPTKSKDDSASSSRRSLTALGTIANKIERGFTQTVNALTKMQVALSSRLETIHRQLQQLNDTFKVLYSSQLKVSQMRTDTKTMRLFELFSNRFFNMMVKVQKMLVQPISQEMVNMAFLRLISSDKRLSKMFGKGTYIQQKSQQQAVFTYELYTRLMDLPETMRELTQQALDHQTDLFNTLGGTINAQYRTISKTNVKITNKFDKLIEATISVKEAVSVLGTHMLHSAIPLLLKGLKFFLGYKFITTIVRTALGLGSKFFKNIFGETSEPSKMIGSFFTPILTPVGNFFQRILPESVIEMTKKVFNQVKLLATAMFGIDPEKRKAAKNIIYDQVHSALVSVIVKFILPLGAAIIGAIKATSFVKGVMSRAIDTLKHSADGTNWFNRRFRVRRARKKYEHEMDIYQNVHIPYYQEEGLPIPRGLKPKKPRILREDEIRKRKQNAQNIRRAREKLAEQNYKQQLQNYKTQKIIHSIDLREYQIAVQRAQLSAQNVRAAEQRAYEQYNLTPYGFQLPVQQPMVSVPTAPIAPTAPQKPAHMVAREAEEARKAQRKAQIRDWKAQQRAQSRHALLSRFGFARTPLAPITAQQPANMTAWEQAGIFGKAKLAMKSGAKGIVGAMKSAPSILKSLAMGIGGILTTVFKAITVGTIIYQIVTKFIWPAIKSFLPSSWFEDVKKAKTSKERRSLVRTAITLIFNSIKKLLVDIITEFPKWIKMAWDVVTELGTTLLSNFIEGFFNVENWIKAGKIAKDVIVNFVQGLINFAKEILLVVKEKFMWEWEYFWASKAKREQMDAEVALKKAQDELEAQKLAAQKTAEDAAKNKEEQKEDRLQSVQETLNKIKAFFVDGEWRNTLLEVAEGAGSALHQIWEMFKNGMAALKEGMGGILDGLGSVAGAFISGLVGPDKAKTILAKASEYASSRGWHETANMLDKSRMGIAERLQQAATEQQSAAVTQIAAANLQYEAARLAAKKAAEEQEKSVVFRSAIIENEEKRKSLANELSKLESEQQLHWISNPFDEKTGQELQNKINALREQQHILQAPELKQTEDYWKYWKELNQLQGEYAIARIKNEDTSNIEKRIKIVLEKFGDAKFSSPLEYAYLRRDKLKARETELTGMLSDKNLSPTTKQRLSDELLTIRSQIFEAQKHIDVYGDPRKQFKIANQSGRFSGKNHSKIPENVFGVPGLLTSPYGTRIHPISKKKHVHTGIDIAGPNIMGKPIRAIDSGEIIFANPMRGYGNVVAIYHPTLDSTLMYAHLSNINVKKGDDVSANTILGSVGKTGTATGPHVHIETSKGRSLLKNRVDPIAWAKEQFGLGGASINLDSKTSIPSSAQKMPSENETTTRHVVNTIAEQKAADKKEDTNPQIVFINNSTSATEISTTLSNLGKNIEDNISANMALFQQLLGGL